MLLEFFLALTLNNLHFGLTDLQFCVQFEAAAFFVIHASILFLANRAAFLFLSAPSI